MPKKMDCESNVLKQQYINIVVYFIDALKEYKELDYITNDQTYIENLLLKNMNKSNILFMNISSLICELDLITY